MGHLLGHGVRFGVRDDVMAAGEGIETMLSLRSVLPTLPMVAALSANHLAALLFPPTLRRLYVARDDDPAGDAAMATPDRPGAGGRDRGARRCRRRSAISTRISAGWASMHLRAALRLQLAPRGRAASWRSDDEPRRDERGLGARSSSRRSR